MSPLHPAVSATPTQTGLFPAPTTEPDPDTDRIPARLFHGRDGDAAPRTCPTCGHWLLTTAITTHADLDPYRIPTPRLEHAATLLGRSTYRLHGTPPHLIVRTRCFPGMTHHLTDQPAHQCVVLATHVCGTPPLSNDPVTIRTATRTDLIEGPPPF